MSIVPPPIPLKASTTTSRVSRTLYRHLLQWCRATDAALPLTQWLPPVYLKAPEEVDPYHLEMLATTTHNNDDPVVLQFARQHLRHAQIHKHHLVASVTHSTDLKDFFRALFRINAALPVQESYQKTRVDNAFQALYNLNQLSCETIAPFMQQRRIDRSGVHFAVGQVVRHVEQRWRGVIVGWETSSFDSVPSSLTSKQYSEQQQKQPTYYILMDAGDAHQLNLTAAVKDVTAIAQDELELETNDTLKRIRHDMVDQLFQGFRDGAFLLPPLLSYTYPNDAAMNDYGILQRALPVHIKEVANQIVNGVQEFAQELEGIMKQHTVVGSLEGLTALATGHVAPSSVDLSFIQQVIHETVHPITLAALHVRELLDVADQLNDALTHRRRKGNQLTFRVGDVVQHKRFGYRGVVTGWDSRPVVDVSRWDGIQHLIQQGKNPNEMPFYHVVRHIEHFEQGADVPGAAMRYVCQENLEECHRVVDMEIDFDDPA